MNRTSIADTPAPLPGEFYDLMQEVLGSLVILRDAVPHLKQLDALKEVDAGVKQLVETDSAHREEMELLADFREKIAKAFTILHEQLAVVEKDVKILRIPPAKKPQPKTWRHWRTVLPWGGGLVGGLALMGGVWMLWPATAREAFAIEINRVLRETHTRMPDVVRDKITTVYRQYGFKEPGHK